MSAIKRAELFVLIGFYFAAGINHFWHPAGYLHIIPVYIPNPRLMNLLAGGFEILFALMLVYPRSRYYGGWGIIFMLAAFLPVHIQMVLQAPFQLGSISVTPLLAWLRVLLQPVLMLWAWWCACRK